MRPGDLVAYDGAPSIKYVAKQKQTDPIKKSLRLKMLAPNGTKSAKCVAPK